MVWFLDVADEQSDPREGLVLPSQLFRMVLTFTPPVLCLSIAPLRWLLRGWALMAGSVGAREPVVIDLTR